MLHGDGEKSQSHSMAAHGMRDEQVVWCGVVWCGVVCNMWREGKREREGECTLPKGTFREP